MITIPESQRLLPCPYCQKKMIVNIEKTTVMFDDESLGDYQCDVCGKVSKLYFDLVPQFSLEKSE